MSPWPPQWRAFPQGGSWAIGVGPFCPGMTKAEDFRFEVERLAFCLESKRSEKLFEGRKELREETGVDWLRSVDLHWRAERQMANGGVQ
jgi:hypothetical protein